MGDGVERLHEVDCNGRHFDSPLVASLGYNLLYSTVVNSLYNESKEQTDRAVVSSIFHDSFFCAFYSHFSLCLWSKFILRYDFVEDLSHHLFRLFVASFHVFGSDSIAVCRFVFF